MKNGAVLALGERKIIPKRSYFFKLMPGHAPVRALLRKREGESRRILVWRRCFEVGARLKKNSAGTRASCGGLGPTLRIIR
jgi:hypothetical protein